MKIISWNVNGLRAAFRKGFLDFYNNSNFDILGIQEIKMEQNQLDYDFSNNGNYHVYFNSANKKGYSGVAIFSKIKPLSISYGMGIEEHDQEGRMITLEFDNFFLINVYTPNSKRELIRLPYRMKWESDFKNYSNNLAKRKSVIIIGDLNVAHQEIDIKNPKSNINSAGFSIQEREKMTQLLQSGFIDTYRHFNPNTIAYTWWSPLFNARTNNVGWRLDYVLASKNLVDKIITTTIYNQIYGSDHCPVGIEVLI